MHLTKKIIDMNIIFHNDIFKVSLDIIVESPQLRAQATGRCSEFRLSQRTKTAIEPEYPHSTRLFSRFSSSLVSAKKCQNIL
jgi:hypothetical protein